MLLGRPIMVWLIRRIPNYSDDDDPLAGWTYRSLPGTDVPPVATNTNHLDQAVVDDYQEYIATHGLHLFQGNDTTVTGYFENGSGKRAILFSAVHNLDEEGHYYVLIYNQRTSASS